MNAPPSTPRWTTAGRAVVIVVLAAAILLVQASCARSVDSEIPGDPVLFGPDTKSPAALSVCVATECPAPWATCPGGGLCATDTSRDVKHCGSCAACPRPPRMNHASAVCASSRCSFACDALYADCNHDDKDGCEVFTGDDPKNCGGCGTTCEDGELCWRGACGCPNGFEQCGIECKDLQSDHDNCGACGSVCKKAKSGDPAWECGDLIQPLNTDWGCGSAACKLVCKPLFGDCNADFCRDGCETSLSSDKLNCGACGNACAAGQDCVNGTCLCPTGTTRCGKRCVQLDSDPKNCGQCGNPCPGPGGDEPGVTVGGSPSCTGGKCGYVCFAGFADCDKKLFNGCEVNIGSDPKHCGGCGTQCDTAKSQPCVSGQCLTKPCDPPAILF